MRMANKEMWSANPFKIWKTQHLGRHKINLSASKLDGCPFLCDKVSGLQHLSLAFCENNSIFRTEVYFFKYFSLDKVLTFIFILEYIWTFYFCFRNECVVLNIVSSMSIIIRQLYKIQHSFLFCSKFRFAVRVFNAIDVKSFVLFVDELRIFWPIIIQQQ